MKRIIATFMVLLICVTLINIPTDIFCSVTADPSEDYPYQPTDEIIIQALDYLRIQQSVDGSIGGFAVTSWAAMTIAASEEDAHDWGNLVEYLRENADRIDDDKATDWERQVLAIVACEENPRDFGGIDYIAKVESFFDGEQIGHLANLYDDFFGILALIASGIEKDSSIIQTVRIYIKQKQHENGGWGDVDSTAAAIMALIASGEHSSSVSIMNALSFIKTTQVESGGFQSWGTANAASTAWAVSAIVAAQQDPTSEDWNKNDNTPIDFLISLRQENGCFNWAEGQSMNPEWMTSYVIPALLGKSYPIKIYESNGGGGGNNGGNEDEWTGNIRIEGKENTIWNGEITVGNSTITAYNDSSGQMEDYFIPYPSVLGALDEASQEGGFSHYVIYYPSWDAFYVQTIAGDSDWWHYWVDYELPMVGAGKYELTEDDNEILWGYLEDWNAKALRISIDKKSVHPSTVFIVTVTNVTLSPVEDALVYVDGMEYFTNQNGEVSISIDEEGTYEIYAEKDGYVRSDRATILVEKKIEIIHPEDNSLYFNNRKTNLPWRGILIVGFLDISISAHEDVVRVEFYIDDEFGYEDTSSPFSWRWNERSLFKKKILVKAHLVDESIIVTSKEVVIFNLFPRLHPED